MEGLPLSVTTLTLHSSQGAPRLQTPHHSKAYRQAQDLGSSSLWHSAQPHGGLSASSCWPFAQVLVMLLTLLVLLQHRHLLLKIQAWADACIFVHRLVPV